MANVYAVKSGNWSDTTVWNTGALPTPADDVFANNFIVTMDSTTTVRTIRSTSATGIAAGGYFVPADGVAVTCSSATGIVSGSGQVIRSSLLAGQVFTLSSAIILNNVQAGQALISHNGPGTFNFNGDISGGGNSNAGILVLNGTFNYTGNISASFNNPNNPGILLNGVNVAASITGNVSNNLSGGYAINVLNCASLSITGSLSNSGGGSTVYISGGSGIVTITGACTGSTTNAVQLVSSYSGTCNVIGQLQAGTAAAVNHTSGALRVTGPFLVAANGIHAIYSPSWRWHSTASTTYYQILANDGSNRPLYTADSVGGNPATTNVRSGTVYGPANELTGTCAVPAASSVAFGVAVDNTTGTAVLTQDAVRTAMGLASANLDTQLDALPTAPENAAAVRTELATELGRIDVATSTRLAPDGTLARVTLTDTVTTLTNDAPLDEEAIAEAVRTELTPELERLANASTTQEVAEIVEGALGQS